MNWRTALFVLLVFVCSYANAQQNTGNIWEIDKQRSSANFVVHLRLAIDSKASSKDIQGQVQWLDEERWQVRVALPSDSLKFSGPAWMDRSAKSKEFLNSKQHPTIVFESVPQTKSLLLNGGVLGGQLQMRGQTQEVQVQLSSKQCEQGISQCLLNVTGTVSRKRFGMSASRWTVKDNIDFNFNIYFVSPQ